jgi:hypothetical protein
MHTHAETITRPSESLVKSILRLHVKPAEEHAKVQQVRNKGRGVGLTLDDVDQIWCMYNVETLEGHSYRIDECFILVTGIRHEYSFT